MGVVVGAAIGRDGLLLAARRSAPAAMAGGWEFPGGKVEPGETEWGALVRECREELGVQISVGERVGPDAVLPNGWTLKVWMASLQPGTDGVVPDPEPLQDHDRLAWVAPEQISSLAWLPADWPIVHALAERLVESEVLPGGRVGGAVRVGDTVRRPVGPWTPAVHDLMRHARGRGVPGVPEPLGHDQAGREVLRYVSGRTVGDTDPVPEAFRSARLAGQVGAWLRSFHDTSASFPTHDRQWRRGTIARRPGQVVCHNDVSPHNVVLDDAGSLVAVLDWDMCAPGDHRDDLAFAAWQFVLRHGCTPTEEATGLVALAHGYGADRTDPVAVLDRVGPRLAGAVRFMRRGAAAGDVGLQRLLTTGIPESTEAGIGALARRRDALVELLRRA